MSFRQSYVKAPAPLRTRVLFDFNRLRQYKAFQTAVNRDISAYTVRSALNRRLNSFESDAHAAKSPLRGLPPCSAPKSLLRRLALCMDLLAAKSPLCGLRLCMGLRASCGSHVWAFGPHARPAYLIRLAALDTFPISGEGLFSNSGLSAIASLLLFFKSSVLFIILKGFCRSRQLFIISAASASPGMYSAKAFYIFLLVR